MYLSHLCWLMSRMSSAYTSLLSYVYIYIQYCFNLPQGFGVAAKSTADCRHCDPMTIICFHQADIGEYIRSEDTLT